MGKSPGRPSQGFHRPTFLPLVFDHRWLHPPHLPIGRWTPGRLLQLHLVQIANSARGHRVRSVRGHRWFGRRPGTLRPSPFGGASSAQSVPKDKPSGSPFWKPHGSREQKIVKVFWAIPNRCSWQQFVCRFDPDMLKESSACACAVLPGPPRSCAFQVEALSPTTSLYPAKTRTEENKANHWVCSLSNTPSLGSLGYHGKHHTLQNIACSPRTLSTFASMETFACSKRGAPLSAVTLSALQSPAVRPPKVPTRRRRPTASATSRPGPQTPQGGRPLRAARRPRRSAATRIRDRGVPSLPCSGRCADM